jgi:hypothetical protein
MHIIYENSNEVVIQFSEQELKTIIVYANKDVKTIPQFVRWVLEVGLEIRKLTDKE